MRADFRVLIPGTGKNEKELVVTNIEILQCVVRGVPRRSLLFRDKSFVS